MVQKTKGPLKNLKKIRNEIHPLFTKEEIKDSVDELEGLLSHVKDKSSVQLQHEANKYRAEMAMNYKKHISRSKEK